MGRSILFCLGILLAVLVKAQQLPHYSQYILNDYVINPASAGVDNFYEAKTNFRSQWVGINEAPRTYILSVNGPLKHEKMGIGGYLFVDRTGPTQRTGIDLSYSYHVKLNDAINLSMSINAGILQYTVAGSEIRLEDENDPTLSENKMSKTMPDAGASFYLYHEDFFFGASAPQLLQNKIDFGDESVKPSGRLVNHYYVLGGYRYDINEQFQLEPSFLLRFVKPLPMQYEFSLRTIYDKMVWLGVSYRKNTAVALLAGYSFNESLTFGYSYDFIQTSINQYSSGTHEIMLSFRIKNRSIE